MLSNFCFRFACFLSFIDLFKWFCMFDPCLIRKPLSFEITYVRGLAFPVKQIAVCSVCMIIIQWWNIMSVS